MDDSHNSHETDVARLLGDHHEGIEMDESFRNRLLQGTRNVVAARTGRRFRRALALAAAAAAAGLAALMLWGPPGARLTGLRSRSLPVIQSQPSPMKVIALHQPVSDASARPLQLGDILPPGSLVRTGDGGRVTLATRRGSEFTLNANTEFALAPEATSVTLGAGQVYCRSRGREIAQISTSAGDIHLLGTVLDAAVEDEESVAVTVVEGQVRLTNDHGEALVDAGRRSLLIADLPPEQGMPVNTFAQTAWYDGRGHVVSDFGDIAYPVRREGAQGLATEVWAMKADGSRKHHVKTYLGWARAPGPWLPGQQWLLVDAHSALWTTPDLRERRAHTGAGHPIVEAQAWLLNAATGQDIPFDLPAGYDPLYMAISPDSTRLAFCGRYRADPDNRESVAGGVWVYDLETGDVAKVLDGSIKTPVSWGPDSRRIATSRGQGYGTHHPLVVVDVDTGEVQDLAVQGARPSVSPDGTKLAYCGDFKSGGSWYRGVPMSGSIWVVDLTSDAPPYRISHPSDGALEPQWSPDGTRVLYRHMHAGYTLFVAAADGSGVIKVYEGPADLRAAAWAPSGDAIYAVTDEGIRLIAADGSGLLADLGGHEHDSILAPDEQLEMAEAVSAAREAIFQYAVGQVRIFEGDARGSIAAFNTASDLFAAIMWDYPLTRFSADNLVAYADNASALGQRSPDEVLAASCEQRMSYLDFQIVECAAQQDEFPSTLAEIEKYTLQRDKGAINWISYEDKKWVKLFFRCPVGGHFTYTSPAAGDPEIGDVIVTCPNHPENSIVWTESLASWLEHSREIAARHAAEQD